MDELIKLIEEWADNRGLIEADPAKQLLKIFEEVSETSQAYIRKQPEEMEVESGDVLVTVIIFAKQTDVDLEHALGKAYRKIADRKGKLVDGSFLKEEDLL